MQKVPSQCPGVRNGQIPVAEHLHGGGEESCCIGPEPSDDVPIDPGARCNSVQGESADAGGQKLL